MSIVSNTSHTMCGVKKQAESLRLISIFIGFSLKGTCLWIQIMYMIKPPLNQQVNGQILMLKYYHKNSVGLLAFM